MVEDLPLPRKERVPIPLRSHGTEHGGQAVDVRAPESSRLPPRCLPRPRYSLVTDRLADVERLLPEGATGVLLPHLTAPIDDGLHPAEFDIMRSGTYNLGFLAGLGETPTVGPFISWWKSKLEFNAASDIERGIFTD